MTENRGPAGHCWCGPRRIRLYELRRVTAVWDHLVLEWEATGLSKATDQTHLNGVFVIQLQGNAIGSVRGYFSTIGLARIIHERS
jgi:hypothetical protein